MWCFEAMYLYTGARQEPVARSQALHSDSDQHNHVLFLDYMRTRLTHNEMIPTRDGDMEAQWSFLSASLNQSIPGSIEHDATCIYMHR